MGVIDLAVGRLDDLAVPDALQNRIAIFVNLPFEGLDRLSLQARLDGIGRTEIRNGDVA